MHEERKTRQKAPQSQLEGPVPTYILDREEQTRAKVLSNTIKQKRKEKAVISSLLLAEASYSSSNPGSRKLKIEK